MVTTNNFGGEWTVEKLNILEDYLNFYSKALKQQPFSLIYIDAFAGTGSVQTKERVFEGSAMRALKLDIPFDKYVFIEKNEKYVSELEKMIDNEVPLLKKRTSIVSADCNEALKDICATTDWSHNRAIVFLDPFSTEVKWDTLETIAATKAIDVWYLFPFSAANRMLKHDGNSIDESWKS